MYTWERCLPPCARQTFNIKINWKRDASRARVTRNDTLFFASLSQRIAVWHEIDIDVLSVPPVPCSDEAVVVSYFGPWREYRRGKRGSRRWNSPRNLFSRGRNRRDRFSVRKPRSILIPSIPIIYERNFNRGKKRGLMNLHIIEISLWTPNESKGVSTMINRSSHSALQRRRMYWWERAASWLMASERYLHANLFGESDGNGSGDDELRISNSAGPQEHRAGQRGWFHNAYNSIPASDIDDVEHTRRAFDS